MGAMNNDLIERLASEVGVWAVPGAIVPGGTSCANFNRLLARFAALVAEECAKECERIAVGLACDEVGAEDCAEAIRAKFKA